MALDRPRGAHVRSERVQNQRHQVDSSGRRNA
jgi:hypothetical protein